MMIGRTFGPYYILDSIRLGGLLADVYLATDRGGQRYALRVLREGLRTDRSMTRQFLKSTEIIQQFDHPNVIKLRAFGKIERVPFAALEYVDSLNLKEAMVRNDPYIAQHALDILRQIVLGLKHIHERGFLHLDLKPENILVPRDDFVRIIDFDLAIPRRPKPRKLRRVSGTLAYLAPELIAEQWVDERTDIFAFGVIAYKLLTGKEPMPAQSRKEMLANYADSRLHFTSPRRHNARIPLALEKIILNCLEKQPMRRYPAVSLIMRDLQQLGELPPLVAPPN
jgi:serine/threonine protein kinase